MVIHDNSLILLPLVHKLSELSVDALMDLRYGYNDLSHHEVMGLSMEK